MQGYKSLLRACKAKHKHTDYARPLWNACALSDKASHTFSVSEIPPAVWCLLTFGLPIAIGNYLEAEKQF